MKTLPKITAKIQHEFPLQEDQEERVYMKAVKARAFDIMRSFLPAGASTNLAWHTNLRQASDKLMYLRHHPLQEVRDIAIGIEEALAKAYPSSFGHKRYKETERYYEKLMENSYYYHNPESPDFKTYGFETINIETLPLWVFQERPKKTELPYWIKGTGMIHFEFQIDFGSYRDIQRHRAVHQRMPLLTSDLGFEEWYLSQLPNEERRKAIKLIEEQNDAIEKLELTPEEEQYYLPMGMKVSHTLSGNLASIIYLIELRATRFVHPTLMKRAREMAEVIRKHFPQIPLHLDTQAGQFDIKRGEHDIVEK